MNSCSLDSCEGLCPNYEYCSKNLIARIKTFCGLREQLQRVYDASAKRMPLESSPGAPCELNQCDLSDIHCILEKVSLDKEEILKYAKVNLQSDLPYIRNCVFENENYSLLVLVWKAGVESKIHSHPCDGCFILPLQGSIIETVYEKRESGDSPTTPEDNVFNTNITTCSKGGEVFQTEDCFTFKQERHFTGGQVSFMSDNVGQVHKIGSTTGCISLHLYTPPFRSCKVWSENSNGSITRSSTNTQSDFAFGAGSTAKMSYFTNNGVPVEMSSYDLEHYI
jgi:cysteine dioxygenase